MTKRWMDGPAMRDAVLARRLMGRAGKPEEMAHMVLFLPIRAKREASRAPSR